MRGDWRKQGEWTWPAAGPRAPRLPEPPGALASFWLFWGGPFLQLPPKVCALSLASGAQVPVSGCPLRPLLTLGLFLFPVALQMPEGLLMFACTIADIIER